MSKFHSTVSRRDFMKGLGLAGAGLGAVAASAPVFHDVDELTSSATHNQQPWYVKELEYGELTTPIDWTLYKPYDGSIHPMPAMFGGTTGPMCPEIRAERAERHKQGIINNWPGSTLRDLALDGATGGNYGSCPWDGASASSPESRGAPGPWQGTKEENLQTLRAAGRFYGTPRLGAIEIDGNIKKLLSKNAAVWEDIDEPYEDDNGVKHIPNSCRWIVVWAVKQNYYMNSLALRNDPDDPWYNTVFRQGKAGENIAYTHGPQIRYYMNRFIKGLGYRALKPSAKSNVQFGVFAGLTEMGRTAHSCSVDYGCMQRYMDFAITDMPLAPSKPTDGGVATFCQACKRCADNCPSGSLSLETEPSWDVVDPGNNPGVKSWSQNWTKCHEYGSPFDCINCQTICPFNHPEDSVIHPIVRATAATTSIFNGFFANMDEMMGYGKQKSAKEHEDWWTRDMRKWPYDNLLGFGDKPW